MQTATSRLAHDSIKQHKEAMYQKILRGLAGIGEGTTEEVAKASGISDEQCRKRIVELERDGKVILTNKLKARTSGRMGQVYKAVAKQFSLFD